jgi:hypothetical protein
LSCTIAKFKLFDGVFGASDEVLGVIESGTDFEKRVFEIHQSARNRDEIDAEFDRLQAYLDERIKADVLDARGKILGFFDQDVVRILQDRKSKIECVKNAFEERLITIARSELPDAKFVSSTVFTHNGETWTTGWPLADERNWKFFRLSDGTLAYELVNRAKDRTLPLAKLTLDYKAYSNGVLADVQQHIGRGGWLRVSRLAVKTAQRTVEHLLLAMLADDGTAIEDATVDRLFCIPAEASTELTLTPPAQSLDTAESAARKRRLDEAEQMNAEFLAKETDKLDAYTEDLEKTADAEIKMRENEIKAKKKEMRSTAGLSVAERVEMQRAIYARDPTAWLTSQPRANRSLKRDSLLSGNLTGNFSNLGLFLRFLLLINEEIQMLAAKFPTKWNREFF